MGILSWLFKSKTPAQRNEESLERLRKKEKTTIQYTK